MSDGRRDPALYAAWEGALRDGSFEEVFSTLEEVVAHLEDGRLPLAESIACYELGVRLAEQCERFLGEAELRVTRLEEVATRFYDPGEAGEDDDADA